MKDIGTIRVRDAQRMVHNHKVPTGDTRKADGQQERQQEADVRHFVRCDRRHTGAETARGASPVAPDRVVPALVLESGCSNSPLKRSPARITVKVRGVDNSGFLSCYTLP